MSLKDRFAALFPVATPKQEQARTDSIEWARGYLALYASPVWRSVLDKIEKMADSPIPIGSDVAAMAGAIGRVNGIREVTALLDSDRRRAQRILDSITGDS